MLLNFHNKRRSVFSPEFFKEILIESHLVGEHTYTREFRRAGEFTGSGCKSNVKVLPK